jgi:GxxExxY protein
VLQSRFIASSDLVCSRLVNEVCLCRELNLRGLHFQRQLPIPLAYKSVKLDVGYRADIVVENSVLIDAKAVEALLPIHEAQLLAYLKLGGWKVGLLINFNVQYFKHGIKRRVLGLDEDIVL